MLNEQTEPFTLDDMRGYKVFTALLTQSGGDDPLTIDTGLLTIGATYRINNNSIGMDFTNVGAANNNLDTFFVATGITPNSWGEGQGTGNGTLAYNTGAPVATILENTIGNVWFTYSDVGLYTVKSNDLFTLNKTICSLSNSLFGGIGDFNSNLIFYSSVTANNEIYIVSSIGGSFANNQLSNTPIEIRVYN